MNWDSMIRAVSAAAGAFIGFMYGELDGLFYALIAMMSIDYISGVLTAVLNKRLSSAVGFRGLVKKIFMLLLVAVGHIIDAYVIGSGAVVMGAVQLFFIANEGISILENSAALGLPVPQKLKSVLEQLKDDSEEGDE